MPYIADQDRNYLDPSIDVLQRALSGLGKKSGHLNYSIVRLLINAIVDEAGNINYDRVNNAVGALVCAGLEFYLRVARPYEDTKIEQNGDLNELAELLRRIKEQMGSSGDR